MRTSLRAAHAKTSVYRECGWNRRHIQPLIIHYQQAFLLKSSAEQQHRLHFDFLWSMNAPSGPEVTGQQAEPHTLLHLLLHRHIVRSGPAQYQLVHEIMKHMLSTCLFPILHWGSSAPLSAEQRYVAVQLWLMMISTNLFSAW